MNIEELLNKYQQQNITKANSLVTKTIYDYNNLELIKKDFYEKSFGLKKALSFMDSFLNRLKTKKHIKQSNDYLNQYNDGEVIIYDFRKKVFYIYQNAVVEDVFLEGYFEIDKNILYIKLYEAMFRAKEKLKLALNLMEIGNIVNWFLSNLRNQLSMKISFFSKSRLKEFPRSFSKNQRKNIKNL